MVTPGSLNSRADKHKPHQPLIFIRLSVGPKNSICRTEELLASNCALYYSGCANTVKVTQVLYVWRISLSSTPLWQQKSHPTWEAISDHLRYLWTLSKYNTKELWHPQMSGDRCLPDCYLLDTFKRWLLVEDLKENYYYRLNAQI